MSPPAPGGEQQPAAGRKGKVPAGAEASVSKARCVTQTMADAPPVALAPRWQGCSELVLERVFSFLAPDDLIRCQQVCRQWHQIACDPRLEACSFVSGLPAVQRQQLRKALETSARSRQLLLHWCDHLAAEPVTQAVLRQLAQQSRPARQLFYTLVQQRLQTRRFSASNMPTLRLAHSRLRALVYSSDGQYLAGLARTTAPGSDLCVTVCRFGVCSLQQVAQFPCTSSLSALAFSPDGRELRAMDTQGSLHRWQRDAGANWQAAEPVHLYQAPVLNLVSSPDGRCLAASVAAPEGLALFGQADSGVWQLQHLWERERHRLRDCGGNALLIPHILLFSQDSQSLLFVIGHDAFVCRRTATGWQVDHPDVEASASCAGQLALAPDGRMLAVMSRNWDDPQLYDAFSTAITLHLWRMTAPGHWCCVTRQGCRLIAGGLPLPLSGQSAVAFSPNGQQLAFPDRRDKTSLLSILGTAEPAVRAEPACLALGMYSETRPPRFWAVNDVQFNSKGELLVVTMNAGIRIARRHGQGGWIEMARVRNPDNGPVSAAFAPDGCHCALALGSGGLVQVFGVHASEQGLRWVRKLELQRGAPVTQLLFTADSGQLVVGSSMHQETLLAGFMGARRFFSCIACLSLVPAEGVAGKDRQVL